MSDSTDQVHLWNYALQVAETLEACPSANAKTILREQMGTLKEAFSDSVDPVENYEAFVLVKLCAAVEQVLTDESA